MSEYLLNCDPLSGTFCDCSDESAGFVASDNFIPPGFRPLLAARPPGRGLIMRGLPGVGDGMEFQLEALGLLIPGGSRSPAIGTPGAAGKPDCPGLPPAMGLAGNPGCGLPLNVDCWPGTPGRILCAGVPCLDRENAFILACISDVSPLALDGGGPGLRAALTAPKGLKDELNGAAAAS